MVVLGSKVPHGVCMMRLHLPYNYIYIILVLLKYFLSRGCMPHVMSSFPAGSSTASSIKYRQLRATTEDRALLLYRL